MKVLLIHDHTIPGHPPGPWRRRWPDPRDAIQLQPLLRHYPRPIMPSTGRGGRVSPITGSAAFAIAAERHFRDARGERRSEIATHHGRLGCVRPISWKPQARNVRIVPVNKADALTRSDSRASVSTG